ncbi:MAG: ATP-binding protein [Planctomycetota bacterium]
MSVHKSIIAKFVVVVGCFTVAFSAFVLYRSWARGHAHLEKMLANESELATAFDLALSQSVETQVHSARPPTSGTEESLPGVMPGAEATSAVSEYLRKNYPEMILRLSSDRPANPNNQAGPEELRAIRHFRENPMAERLVREIEVDGKAYQAQFSPRRMGENCIRCHGNPDDADALSTTGNEADLDALVGKVIGVHTVAIPIEHFKEQMASEARRSALVLILGLSALLAAIYGTFHLLVGRRLGRIARHFGAAAEQADHSRIIAIDDRGTDEIGVLAQSYNLLANHLRGVYASLEERVAERTEELASSNAELTKEINTRKRAEKDLNARNRDLQELHDRLHATADALTVLMRAVVDDNAFTARFQNRSLRRCWEVKACANHTCVAYDRHDNLRCWEIAGTFCRGEVQGAFARKLKDCRLCEVYQSARADSVHALGETFNNLIAVLGERQEALEEARQAAEAANSAKSRFLANMSHEIRTPMTAILGFSESMLQGEMPESERADALETICRNGRHLLSIINDILDISKVEAGKMTLEHIACSPLQLVAEVQSLMQVRAAAKGIEFQVEYLGPVPQTIQTDPTRLRQVLINLIDNAIKFTDAGSVRLAIEFQSGQSPELLFDVVDTGIGITPEQAARIFHPFTQADDSTTRQFGGTGLGLTLSRQLVRIMGGDVTVVESPVNAGTRFRISIPTGPLEGVNLLNPTEGMPLEAPHEKRPEATGAGQIDGRILVAEDGPDNQRLIALVLSKAGAEVTVVENGRLAVDAALEARRSGNPFDLILMDMQMPVMDGYEATAFLRREGYTGKIVALTAHAMARDCQKCRDAGCDDYASKPFTRTELLEVVRRHVPAERPAEIVSKHQPA